jgi:ATP-dependent DNA ligase
MPPVEPMLASSVKQIPVAPGMTYEPKWDGFRCIVFRDGDEVELASRGGKTLTRYFPEVVEYARRELPPRCVIDGELVAVLRHGLPRLDFDTLGQRIHPAASRVRMLAEHTPASFIAFDLLALGDENLLDTPYPDRRARLETALAGAQPPVHLTPVTADLDTARRWFEMFEGAGLDGLVAKPAGLSYTPGKRLMYKIKHARTADVVVAGFRWHKSALESKDAIGSLLLGLYDDKGTLHHVGVSASFSASRRKELLTELMPYRTEIGDHPWAGFSDGQRVPGTPSRWSGAKDLSWLPVRPELVCEVAYDHLEDDRFRHTAQFVRWRPDRDPLSCTYDQLERPVRFDVDRVLAGQPEERP